VLALAVVLGALVGTPQRAEAVTGSEFNPGLIISDSVFFNEFAMTQPQIQDFLNVRVPTCTAGYTCLKSYTETTAGRSADAWCSAYPAGTNELASTIIFKVAQACGINPQVLLVTLQKENSLVTSTKPSAGSYKTAMGYACPDTAACDAKYYGFFNQVYSAGRQLVRYGDPSLGFRYQQGNEVIQFHPNASCGTTVVNIRSQGTATLYNYTPYQPNAASLANLGGTGDACSSYGNRNFWVFFNNWFGSPVASGSEQLADYYALAGGASGWLGAPTGDVVGRSVNGGGLYRTFQNGVLYWSLGAGVRAVSGEMLTAYAARGAEASSLGWPTGEVSAVSGSGLTGTTQAFQNGSLYVAPGTAYVVPGLIRGGYAEAGGPASAVGWPIAEARSSSAAGGGQIQEFQNGSMYGSNAGAFPLSSALRTAYLGLGAEAGNLGWPVSGVYTISANGGGTAQGFQRGSLYSSPAGAFPVYEPSRTSYWSVSGESGVLGWPLSGPVTVAANGGGTAQTFQGGALYSSRFGAFTLTGATAAAFQTAGGPAGSMGWPAGGPYTITANGGGTAFGFQFASIYTSTAGAFAVSGPIRDFYWSMLGEGGALGWPTAAQSCTSATACTQNFQNGTVVWSASGGTRLASNPQIEAAFAANAEALGAAASPLFTIAANGGGLAQGFRNGSIYQGNGLDAYAVLGPIRSAYWSVLGEGGPLGWPTGPQVSVAANGGGVVQTFQNGAIYSSPAGGLQIVQGAMQSAFVASGGAAGPWGWPASTVFTITANGGGTAQGFQKASVYSSSAGAFAVAGSIRSLYWSLLGEGGALGWPTANAVCQPDGSCSQTFQNGTILSSPSGVAYLRLLPEIDAAYQALGGAAGSLGEVISPLYTIAANGGGYAQGFRNGSIYYSPASGAYAVTGPIRAYYWSLLGEGGSLGWPTAAQQCTGSTCSQTFQHGTIVSSPTTGTRLG